MKALSDNYGSSEFNVNNIGQLQAIEACRPEVADLQAEKVCAVDDGGLESGFAESSRWARPRLRQRSAPQLE